MAEWITDRLPTEADVDSDGDVVIKFAQDSEPEEGTYAHFTVVVPGQPWWSRRAAARGAHPAPAPAPATARVVTVMAANDLRLYAACNDGTIWTVGALGGEWDPIAPIPQPETHDA